MLRGIFRGGRSGLRTSARAFSSIHPPPAPSHPHLDDGLPPGEEPYNPFVRVYTGPDGRRPVWRVDGDVVGVQRQKILTYTGSGDRLLIPRDVWYHRVLAPTMAGYRGNEERMTEEVSRAFGDGFASTHLVGMAMQSIWQQANKNARVLPLLVEWHLLRRESLPGWKALHEHIKLFPERDGRSLTAEARLQLLDGNREAAVAGLHEALKRDPNNNQALSLLLQLTTNPADPTRVLSLLERLSEAPGAWQAPLHYAEHATRAGSRDGELVPLVRRIVSIAPPEESLWRVCVVLHAQEQHPEIVATISPTYDVSIHEPQVGLYLLDSYFKIGEDEEGSHLVEDFSCALFPAFEPDVDGFRARHREKEKLNALTQRLNARLSHGGPRTPRLPRVISLTK